METLILLTISVSAFIATNLDDLSLLAAFFSSRAFSNASVVLGQYFGFCILILVSIMASFLNLIIPSSLISLMGFLPILIGIKNLIDIKNNQGDDFKEQQSYFKQNKGTYPALKVAMVTMANGGDNLGVYIPLMASVDMGDTLGITMVFLILTGIWCILSYKLVNNRFMGRKIFTYGHLILPFVLIGIGIIILFRGGGISLLANTI
ncbi:MAG: cadmium resistance transporter [Methanobacteriaceae archaeon]